jgi:hypothetical protein
MYVVLEREQTALLHRRTSVSCRMLGVLEVDSQCQHMLEMQRGSLSKGGRGQLRLVLVALELF